MAFTEILPKKIKGNVFDMIGDSWMLITAGTQEKCNTMTASWGGFGVLWSKPTSFIFVRHSRYTFHFVEEQDYYSLCFFPKEYKKKLAYLGEVSGRDENKIKTAELTTAFHNGVPYFEEASMVLICKKEASDDLGPANFIDKTIEDHYKDHDYHRMFIGEIVTVLKKD